MIESIFAVSLFWMAFAFSPGPFWMAVMQSATHQPIGYIYRQYAMYHVTGWLSLVVTIALLVYSFGQFNPAIIAWLYVIGVLVIFWLAFKVVRSQLRPNEAFDFNWKAMNITTWSNPKCWLLLPIGYLSANFSESLPMNIALYYLMGVPIFFGCLFLWAAIGKLGAKVSLRGITYGNLLLLLGFGVYLGYEGYQQMILLYA